MSALDAELRDVMTATVREMSHGDRTPIAVITGLVTHDAGIDSLKLRHKAAPMHLVMATYALAGETEVAIRRAAGDHSPQLAALAVARHALKQAME